MIYGMYFQQDCHTIDLLGLISVNYNYPVKYRKYFVKNVFCL